MKMWNSFGTQYVKLQKIDRGNNCNVDLFILNVRSMGNKFLQEIYLLYFIIL